MKRSGLKNYTFENGFTTESGEHLSVFQLAYQTWGELDESKDNVILICHALTGTADAETWFSGLFSENSPIVKNTFILCVNVPGSCYGSTGPLSTNPETGKKYRVDFPEITIRDMVEAQKQLLDKLEINGIELVIGGSMGGMQALEFAVSEPRVKRAAIIAAGARHEAWAIGISEAQRNAIYSDANWNNGYYSDNHPPERGLAAARMMAMVTYRTSEQYNDKFSREKRDDNTFQIVSYLNYQGKKLTSRFDAVSYVRLTQAMDSHDVGRDRGGIEKTLAGCNVPVLVIGISSDLLYPVQEQKKLASLLANGCYKEIESPYGHDAFLIEFKDLNNIISDFLNGDCAGDKNQIPKLKIISA